MVHGVIAHAVTAAQNFVEQLGVAAHIVAHEEEGGFHAIEIEGIEHPRCHLWDRTVVESEKYCSPFPVYPPHGLGEQYSIK